MQHDTTIYQVKLAGQRTKVIASLLYLRYSKRRYLKFYRTFNRFAMKCFLHEALMFWGCAARQCIIDNTNLARLRGAGKRAVIVPEMTAFSRRYGFEFVCHAIDHPNRKVTGAKFFNWHRHEGGGGAIDLVMHLSGWDVHAAVSWLEQHLTGDAAAAPSIYVSSPSWPPSSACQGGSAKPGPRLPVANLANLDRVHRYLSEQRYLAASVVEPLIEAGKVLPMGAATRSF